MLHKQFRHRFVPEVELTRETIDGQRFYVLPDGTKLKSVTTVLGEKLDKTSLLEWKKRVGEEEAKRISTQAARRGTAIHSMAEKYVLNESDIYNGQMPVNIETFKKIKTVLDSSVDTIMGVELPLFSRVLKCAGTTDLVCEFDGVLSIVDFKTSKKPKEAKWIEGYFLQSTVYSMMFEQIYSIKVPQICIIVAVDDEKTPQVFKLERKQFVNRVLEVFV